MTFTVCFVYAEDTDYAFLREFCEERSIIYKDRYFNSSKHSLDRDYILRLPAIHILANNVWKETVYPGFDAIQKIEQHYSTYMERRMKTSALWKTIRKWMTGYHSLKTDSLTSRPRLSSK